MDDDLNLLGEGWHEQFGGPHAEVNAISAAGDRCRGATLYVTLEPCSHQGKTPPCADAVIAAGFRKVVVAMRDPAPHVDGQGTDRLRAAGIEVEIGLLESEARRLTAPFVTLTTRGRPYIHAKWAMTLDGRIASRTGHSQWISSDKSRASVHRLRGRMDAILVGVGTVLADDPLLTARPAGPRVATRIVLDSRGRMPVDCQLIRTVDAAPLLVATTDKSPADWRETLHDRGAEVLIVAASIGSGRVDVAALLHKLGQRQMTNLLVEGGSEVLGALFDVGLVDECHVFIAPKVVGGSDAPGPVGGVGLETIPEFTDIVSHELMGADTYIHVVRAEVLN